MMEETRPASKPDQTRPMSDQKSQPVKETSADGQAELATAIDDLLDTVGSKFKTMSKDIMVQMDQMAARLDELEAQAKASVQNDTNRDSTAS